MNYITNIIGVFKQTFHIASTDVSQSFTTTQLQNANGKLPIQCLISCEGEDIRFTHGATGPTAGADGAVTALGHIIYAKQSYLITNTANITNFQFLSKIAGSHGDIQVTMFYEIGD